MDRKLNYSAARRELAHRLTSARVSAGVTQAELAAKIGREQTFLSKVEGQQRKLDVIDFVQIMDALKSDPMYILRAVSNALR